MLKFTHIFVTYIFTLTFLHYALTAPQFPSLFPATPQPPPFSPAPQSQSPSNGGAVARARVVSPPNSNGRVNGDFEFYEVGNNQIGVRLTVNGLDTVQPIMQHRYHIHAHPIGRDGDCAAALGHLSPNGLPDNAVCNPQSPGRCQEGDLAGKHGLLPGNERVVTRQYTDTSLRLQPERESILGRSVVIHGQDNSRVACGNIISSLDGTADFSGRPTGRQSNIRPL
ncbi:Cu/Zn superoxide dismutase [Melampsora larici-populina 98AG31]|uniref:Cu/Zn superoxide dismutase n=1 Tax=Melampsora larici-populina (strain 98AG31 / pathotype 3-4-7) TaxID=747676 RepID=F4RW16_MELLP|nr:Cu/Zn superoxide dismutase [Melampsora larici-populina 98AG31]EGG03458.1 Cu/Zn superoxide dismutase [Melampsora larici-populina 98AG31]